MFGNFGFSYIGLIYLLMLWIPNTMWSKQLPMGYDSSGENKILLVFERIGQVLCTASILFFTDFNPKIFEPWTAWFIASAVIMFLYEVNWVCYFRSEKTASDFYRSFFGIPTPGATLPVVAFLLLGIYGKVIWLIISAIIFGIGHIGIHLQHIKNLKGTTVNEK